MYISRRSICNLKIYLASRYLRRDELREYRKQLKDLGHEITSRWLAERKDQTSTMHDLQSAQHEVIATRDLEDIDAADMFVVFGNEPRNQKRGGHWVELGYAIGKGKEAVVLEEQENSFCFLESITFYKTFEEFLEGLNGRT